MDSNAKNIIKAVVFDCIGVICTRGVFGWRRDQQLLTYIQELRHQYKVGMLSNLGVRSMDEAFPPSEREQFFDAVVTSGEAGIAKPHPDIYHLICQRLGVEPSQVVFVDDGADNIKGAQAIGMRAVLYRDFATFQHELADIL